MSITLRLTTTDSIQIRFLGNFRSHMICMSNLIPQ